VVVLFNTGDFTLDIAVRWSDLGISGKRTVRDLWRQKDLGEAEGQFEAQVNSHGVVLVRMRTAK
jgi:alpha-galactosidase